MISLFQGFNHFLLALTSKNRIKTTFTSLTKCLIKAKKVENIKNNKNLLQNCQIYLGPEMSLVSVNYHEPAEPVVMVMASINVKIRHVFGDTPIT